MSETSQLNHGREARIEVEEQIKRLRQLWVHALNRRDVEALIAFYTDDAIVLPPNGVAVRGAAAIRELLESMWDKDNYSDGRFEPDQIEYSGNMAVEIGAYSAQVPVVGGAGLREDAGRYMATWRRQDNGDFHITVNVWSSK